jgi:hypothetical protein
MTVLPSEVQGKVMDNSEFRGLMASLETLTTVQRLKFRDALDAEARRRRGGDQGPSPEKAPVEKLAKG